MILKQRQNLIRLIILVFVIAVSLYIFSIRDQAKDLAKYGYPGIFLLSILANGTVLLPAPGVLFVFAMGAVFNPIGVAIAAGSGAALGELTGYLLGYSGQAVVDQSKTYLRLHNWMTCHPRLIAVTILILAFIPNPFLDLAGMTAGSLKYPIYLFLFWCWLGKILKMLAFAYAGASSLNWFFHL